MPNRIFRSLSRDWQPRTPDRRYEILLPRRFNDGVRVPKHLLERTTFELEQRFGAVGLREHLQGVAQAHSDELSRIELPAVQIQRVEDAVAAE